MKCPKCGSEVVEGAAYCTSCGAEMTALDSPKDEEGVSPSNGDAKPQQSDAGEPKAAVPAEQANETDVVKEGVAGGGRVPYYITACVGIFVAIIGFTALTYSGNSIFEMSFGGDVYTYIYKGIYAIWGQPEQILRCVGVITFGTGVTMTCVSIAKLSKAR